MATEQQVALKLYLAREDAEYIRAIARQEGRTVTGLIRLAIREYRDRHEEKE